MGDVRRKCGSFIKAGLLPRLYYRDKDDKVDGIEHLLEHGVIVNSGWLKAKSK